MERSIKSIWESALGLFLLFATVSVNAQTVGAGPYYATPSWDQTLPSNTRFIVLSNFNGQAVLDRETGLVWERSPDTNLWTWLGALGHCISSNLGGRKGWRLPSINEFASLVDPTAATLPPLPSGHPFVIIQIASGAQYWSATTSADAPTLAWQLLFGEPHVGVGATLKSNLLFAWCVRGGAALDNY